MRRFCDRNDVVVGIGRGVVRSRSMVFQVLQAPPPALGDDLSVQMPPADAKRQRLLQINLQLPPLSRQHPLCSGKKPADAPAETPKQSSVDTFKGTKFVANTSLKVPNMSCPHGLLANRRKDLGCSTRCRKQWPWPSKKTEDSIDNPTVYVKLNGQVRCSSSRGCLGEGWL